MFDRMEPLMPPYSPTDPLIIRESRDWAWKVFSNQAHLGHMMFIARRETEGSLADCSAEEWQDLHSELALYERVMTELFVPDRLNYGQFGNVWGQLHVHAYPRYGEAPEWNGIAFPDVQWGAPPIPEPPSPLEGAALEEFAAWFKERLDTLA